jgi:hypothetical protein
MSGESACSLQFAKSNYVRLPLITTSGMAKLPRASAWLEDA